MKYVCVCVWGVKGGVDTIEGSAVVGSCSEVCVWGEGWYEHYRMVCSEGVCEVKGGVDTTEGSAVIGCCSEGCV